MNQSVIGLNKKEPNRSSQSLSNHCNQSLPGPHDNVDERHTNFPLYKMTGTGNRVRLRAKRALLIKSRNLDES